MRYLKLFIVLSFMVISCNKEDEPSFKYLISADITRYVIELSGTQIISYTKYTNDVLTETVSFHFSDSEVVRLTRNSQNQIAHKRVYQMGGNSLAASCIDTAYSTNALIIGRSSFEYENGYLTKETYNWKVLGEGSDSGQVFYTRTIENGNVSSVNEAYTNWMSGCNDLYSYTNEPNRIDVIDFSNGLTGKISKDLVEHISWRSGCPCGPSSSIAYTDYEYRTNSDGYITSKLETYTPCYHLSFSEEVTKTLRTTIYEYRVL